MKKNTDLKRNNWWSNIDKFIFIPTILLLLIGIISISSITHHFSGNFYSSSELLLKKHLIFCIIGIFIVLTASQLSLKNLIFISFLLFFMGLLLTSFTIFFFPETKGASRWIKFFNFSFQPSELLKPSFIIISSVLLGRYKIKNDYSIFINIFFLIIISLLLIIQPDFGMFVLVFMAWLIQMITSRLKLKIIFPILFGFVAVSMFCFLTLNHVRFRIMNFLFSDVGDNYQITKSINSFENGGFLGKGLGEGSIAKSLPDVHSDFIFALIGEELGSLSAIIIMIMYLVMYVRAHLISQRSNNFFIISSMTGLSNILIFQAIINISSALNIIPTKGMTLPFISYGGSSFISCSIIIGFMLSLAKESKNG